MDQCAAARVSRLATLPKGSAGHRGAQSKGQRACAIAAVSPPCRGGDAHRGHCGEADRALYARHCESPRFFTQGNSRSPCPSLPLSSATVPRLTARKNSFSPRASPRISAPFVRDGATSRRIRRREVFGSVTFVYRLHGLFVVVAIATLETGAHRAEMHSFTHRLLTGQVRKDGSRSRRRSRG